MSLFEGSEARLPILRPISDGARPRWLAALGYAALAAIAGLAGVLLTAVASRADNAAPIALLALVLGPLLIAAVVVDPRIGIVCIFLSFPAGFRGIELGVFNLQATDAAVLLVAVVVALRRIGTGSAPLSWSAPLVWAVGMIGWAIVATPSAADKTLAVKQLGYLIDDVVLACLVLAAFKSARDLRVILSALVIVSVAITIQALTSIHELTSFYSGAVVSGRAAGLFQEPNQLGDFCAMTALLTAGMALGAKTRWGTITLVGAFGVLVTGLTLSLSRGAWIAAVPGVVLLALLLKSARRTIAVLAIPILIMAFSVGAFAPSHPDVRVIGERFHSLTTLNQPYDDRLAIWREAIRETRNDPWTGVGPGNFAVASQRSTSLAFTAFAPHAHNIFLNTAAEMGLPGVAFLVALIVALAFAGRTALKAMRKTRRSRELALTAGICAALFATLIQGLTNTFTGNSIIDGTIWTLIGALLVARREARTMVEEQAAAPTEAPATA
ncbi:MAG: O-antigen ligase family protein [Actinomycetota bacterium]